MQNLYGFLRKPINEVPFMVFVRGSVRDFIRASDKAFNKASDKETVRKPVRESVRESVRECIRKAIKGNDEDVHCLYEVDDSLYKDPIFLKM